MNSFMMLRPLLRCLHCTKAAAAGFKQGRGTGDSGQVRTPSGVTLSQSSLFSNERRWKDDAAFAVLGPTDELSSVLGLCRCERERELERLEGKDSSRANCLATPPSAIERKERECEGARGGGDEGRAELTAFDPEMVDWLNAEFDRSETRCRRRASSSCPRMAETRSDEDAQGAGEAAARAVCRRAERAVVPLVRDGHAHPQALVFHYCFSLSQLAG
jgi:cob(I)alamin adenosyltransferase